MTVLGTAHEARSTKAKPIELESTIAPVTGSTRMILGVLVPMTM